YQPFGSDQSPNAISLPSSEMRTTPEPSSQERSRSRFSPSSSALMPSWREPREMSARPSATMSSTLISLGIVRTGRSLPSNVTASNASREPDFVAVNQTSFPSGDQASPPSPSQSWDSTVVLPLRSTTATSPRSS